MMSPEEGGISRQPDAVQCLLRNPSQYSRVSTEIAGLRTVSQGLMITKRELATEFNQAVCRCANVRRPEKILLLFVGVLHFMNRSVVARCSKWYRRITSLDVADIAWRKEDAVNL